MSRSRGVDADAPSTVGRVTGRPTPLGIVALVATVAAFATSGSARDPILAGIVWVSLGAVTLMGWVWPFVAIATVRVRVTPSSTDGRVGGHLPALLSVTAAVPVTHVEISLGDGEPKRCSPGVGDEPVTLPSDRRAVLRRVRAEVSTDGPVGFLRARRRFDATLPAPVYVGPEPTPEAWTSSLGDEVQVDEVGRGIAGHSDVVRSVRPYRVGDPAHLVHWPSSARTGAIVVRELEPPAVDVLVVVLRLAGVAGVVDPEGERAVSRAAGIVLDALASGVAVWLCSCEDGEPQSAEVSSPFQLNRRLAAATVGEPGVPPPSARNWPVLELGS